MIILPLIYFLIQFNYSFAAFKCPSSYGLFNDNERCTHYWECENWIATLKVCGTGLFFSQNKKVCDWPDSVDQSFCRSGSNHYGKSQVNIISPNTGSSNHITFICHADGLYEDPISCTHYVECSGGSPFRKNCPSNLFFDIRIKGCNWPESTECKKHTNPLTTKTPVFNSRYTSATQYTSTNQYTSSTPRYIPYLPENTPEPDNYDRPPVELTNNQKLKPDDGASTISPFKDNCEWCFKCPNLEDKYYENSFDKLTYYHCLKGTPYLMYCPRNSIWIQRLQTCESEKLDESLKRGSEDGAGLIDKRKKPKSNDKSTPRSTYKLN